MSSYTLESLTSENVGHVFAAIGLASALHHQEGHIHWQSADTPSSPTLTVDAVPAAINGAIVEAIQTLVDDWAIILPQCFRRVGLKGDPSWALRDGGSDEEREVHSGWIGCDRDELYAIFDRLPDRLRARLAPWVSAIAVEAESVKGVTLTTKPRTQLAKTKFAAFFAPGIASNVTAINESVGALESLVSPLGYMETMPWSDETLKTGYDVISTLKDGGKTQSAVGATLAHPLVEALILLGLEFASLRPGIRMPRSRITRSAAKTGEALIIPLWTTPLSVHEIEAHVYDSRADHVLVVPLAPNGKNIVPLAGSFERVGGGGRVQSRSKAENHA